MTIFSIIDNINHVVSSVNDVLNSTYNLLNDSFYLLNIHMRNTLNNLNLDQVSNQGINVSTSDNLSLQHYYDTLFTTKMVQYMIQWGVLLMIFKTLTKKRAIKPMETATVMVSLCNAIYYIYAKDSNVLLSYYMYDMFYVLYTKQWIYVTHHLGSLLLVGLPGNHPDHNAVKIGTYLMKMGDMFLHPHKILNNMYVKTQYTYYNYILLVSYVLSCITWIIYRVLLGFGLYPFVTTWVRILCLLLHIVNFQWMFKLIKKTVLLIISINDEKIKKM